MEHNAESAAVVTVVWSVAVPIRDSTDPSAVEPATAPIHAGRATRRPCRVVLTTAAVIAVPVLAPLPNVTAHVVDSKFVW